MKSAIRTAESSVARRIGLGVAAVTAAMNTPMPRTRLAQAKLARPALLAKRIAENFFMVFFFLLMTEFNKLRKSN